MTHSPEMQVQFLGAAGEVTGSRHLVECGKHKVLLDCGMIQGGRGEAARNAGAFGFDARRLNAVVVSHAHIDHIGRLPLLLRRGYRGPIYATPATIQLARIMLEDSASLAAADAERETRARLRRGEEPVEPLYSLNDVADTLARMRPIDYGAAQEILPGIHVDFEDAGHIIGAASVGVTTELGERRRRLVFSGDIGPKGTPFLCDPTPRTEADLLLLESTYGDRLHRPRAETVAQMGEILDRAWQDGGNVLIPAFAVGRSQELLYWFARHFQDWGLARWKIYLDSPMAAKVVEVYKRHAELFDADGKQRMASGKGPFQLSNLRLVSDAQDSMALNRRGGGAIIIAGSGMCNGGRIRHHLRHNLWRENADVLFVGYQAMGTLGRRLVDGAPFVTIFGEKIRVKARRHTIGGLSAHADQAGLLEWYGHFSSRPPVALVHGEDGARHALAAELKKRFGAAVTIAMPGGCMSF
ncbi:MAG: MBL fold metallo-hydrolase RNA specificity domain-containing protein [Pseudomarimonas sp.]